jgi:protein SCO1/2
VIKNMPLQRGRLFAGLVGVAAGFSIALHWPGLAPADEPRQRGPLPKRSDSFSNVTLTTQHGQTVRFYDDLVKDRTVVINLMYSGCGDICPDNSAALRRVHERLGERIERGEITLLSISIDPAGDTPERLKKYWETFGAKPGWLFLTGKPADVERLRRQLGLHDPDPERDADPAQHTSLIAVGNDRADRWIALPTFLHVGDLAHAIMRVSRFRRALQA